jgi:large subunit ribosomal protein L21
MYAIIKAGGKQYKVEPGDVLRVEKLDAELGSEMDLKEILLVGGDKTFVGAPMLSDAVVTVIVTNQQRAPKVTIFKKKRRQGYRRMGGHRQPYTELFIKSITSPEGQTSKAEGKAQVYNPEKKAENQAKTIEARAQFKQAEREGKAPEAKAAATPKKKVAKKATGAKKKSAGAKKSKSTGAKKTAKKTTKK